LPGQTDKITCQRQQRCRRHDDNVHCRRAMTSIAVLVRVNCSMKVSRLSRFGGATLSVLGLVASTSLAATYSWDGNGAVPPSGNFDVANNWNPNTVPGSGDTAEFSRGGGVSYTVIFPGTGSAGATPVNYVSDQLRVGNNAVSFLDATSALPPQLPIPSTYTLLNTTTAESGRGIIIGVTGSDTAAALTTQLASLSAAAATLGDAAGSNGTLNVSAGTFHVTGSSFGDRELIIGNRGTGLLNVSGGAGVNVDGGYGDSVLGKSIGSRGTATVSGVGSSWANGLALYVGQGGDGKLNVTTGGQVTSATGYLGYSAAATGLATVDGAGSTWTNTDLFVGYSGMGTVNVIAGGQVRSLVAFLGVQPGSAGTVRVDGAGSAWINTGNVIVGTAASGTLSVDNSSSVSVGGLLSIGSLGTTKGNGTIVGNVSNGGVVAPGNSFGALHITGNYTQTTSGRLQIELGGLTAGTQYDQLLASGAVALDGTLQVSLVGFSPAAGNSFNILDFASLTGKFATLDLPLLHGGLTWNASQLYTTGSLSVGGVLGDYNRNGIVDAADYAIWRDSLGQTGSGLAADGNGDHAVTPADYDLWKSQFGQAVAVAVPGDYNHNGIVDAADYTVWRDTLGSTTNLTADGSGNDVIDAADYDVWKSNFGRTSGSGSAASAAVPEPTTLVLLILAAIGIRLRSRHLTWRLPRTRQRVRLVNNTPC
jgi:T5SS/PEP-CTERM-associated repeat protein